ncbi:MFS transporter [Ammoniphilus sp. CFH 90114]|uniref:MFS transporter n=1 Tax=Ammoniphilus sp. CFH 90114 TaxID=2493665 RepID=UPI0013E98D9F|nr:MFS transporter [Ammoniphilus sp. CFH 90114]
MIQYFKQIWTLPYAVRLFLISESFLGIGQGIFSLLFNLHLLALHVDESQIGKITAVGTVVMGIGSISISYFIDQWGRKRTLLTGVLLIGAGSSGVALGSELLHFYMAYGVYSFGLAMLVASEFSLLFMYCETKQQETLSYSMVFAVFTLFVGLGTYIGGILPKYLGTGVTTYQVPILLTGGIIFLVFATRLFLPKEIRKTPAPGERKKTKWVPSTNVFIFTGFSIFLGASFALLVPFFNIILKYRLTLQDDQVALLLTLNGLVLFFSSLFSPFFLEKWGLRKTTMIIFLTTVVPSFILGLALPLSLFVMVFLFRSGVFTALQNVLEGQMMQATPDEDRSIYAGMRSLGRSMASSVMSLITGYILLVKNYYLPFVLSGAILALGYFYFQYLVLPRLEQSDSEAQLKNSSATEEVTL